MRRAAGSDAGARGAELLGDACASPCPGPRMRSRERVLQLEHRASTSSCTILPTGMPVQAATTRRDHVLVDVGVDHGGTSPWRLSSASRAASRTLAGRRRARRPRPWRASSFLLRLARARALPRVLLPAPAAASPPAPRSALRRASTDRAIAPDRRLLPGARSRVSARRARARARPAAPRASTSSSGRRCWSATFTRAAAGVEQVDRLVRELAAGDVAAARGCTAATTASSRMMTPWASS